MGLSYLFFGAAPGERLPSLKGMKVAKHTKANAQGKKGERGQLREIPRARFQKVESIRELVGLLFGLSD
jgi:hypothetical protein